jgi:inner membrane protein
MPTAFTHIFIAGTLGKTGFREKMPLRFWVLTAVCSILPDIDIIGFYMGIKYSDMLGHRGFFHSLPFALIVSLVVVPLAFPAVSRFSKKWWGLIAFFFLVLASHGLLDSMTDKGLGVGFFIPFDNTRYYMFWRPVYAAPMKIEKLLGPAGLELLIEEIIWIWTPVIVVDFAIKLYRKKMRSPA